MWFLIKAYSFAILLNMLQEQEAKALQKPDMPFSERQQHAVRIYHDILDAADVGNPNRVIYLSHYDGSRDQFGASVEYKGVNGRHIIVRSSKTLLFSEKERIGEFLDTEELDMKLMNVVDVKPGERRVNWWLKETGNGEYEGVKETWSAELTDDDSQVREVLSDPDILDILGRVKKLVGTPRTIAETFGSYDAFIESLGTEDLMPGVVTDADGQLTIVDEENGEIMVSVFGDNYSGNNSLRAYVHTATDEARERETRRIVKEQEMMEVWARERHLRSIADISEPYGNKQHELFKLLQVAFHEAYELELPQRVVKGAFHQDFEAVFTNAVKEFKTFFPHLPQELLFSLPYLNSYLGPEGQDILRLYDNLPPGQRRKIKDIRESKERAIRDISSEKVLPTIEGQILEAGHLDATPFQSQTGERQKSCTVASIRMLFEGITGNELQERTIMGARNRFIKSLGVIKDPDLHDEEYLELFQTPAFKEHYGIDVRSIALSGVDLSDISRVVQKIKAKDDKYKVFCMISLATDHPLVIGDGIWHSAILLSAEEESVTIHDPSTVTGQPNRKLNKAEFVPRWGETFLRGHLVIAK